jgi:choline dehydrogenase-like flavoprotein
MANLNGRARRENTYDAIVVGSGITGGWAAKELTQKGLKVLVLERGRMVRHLEDYPTATLDPWQTKYPQGNCRRKSWTRTIPCSAAPTTP